MVQFIITSRIRVISESPMNPPVINKWTATTEFLTEELLYAMNKIMLCLNFVCVCVLIIASVF